MNPKSKATLGKYENIMRVKGYSKRTIEVYSHYLGVFLTSFSADPYHISKAKASSFLLSYKYSSKSQQNQFISDMKYKFKNTQESKPQKFFNWLNADNSNKNKEIKALYRHFILFALASILLISSLGLLKLS